MKIPAPPKGFVLEHKEESPYMGQGYAEARSTLPRQDTASSVPAPPAGFVLEEPMIGGGGSFRGHGAQGSFAEETLGENIKGIRTIDVLAHLPFSPLHDYEKKGAVAAKKRLEKGEYGKGKGYGTMPMGEYLTIKQPETKEELEKIVTDYEERLSRGQTIPASIASGIADLPGYMGEMYAGGIGKVKGVGGALKFATKMTAMQPHRIQSALIDQIDRGETGGMALAKAWGDVYIENLSETAGAGFGKAVSKLPFGGKMMEGMRKFAKSIGMSDSEFWKTVGTKVGYNGLLGEWGEERIGTYLRGLTGVQDFGAGKDATADERIAAGFEQDFEARNALTELGVLLAPGAAKYAGQKILGPEPGRKTPYEDEPSFSVDAGRMAMQGGVSSVGLDDRGVPPISEAVRRTTEDTRPPLLGKAIDTSKLPPVKESQELEAAKQRAAEKLSRKVTKAGTGRAEGPLVGKLYSHAEELIEKARAETDENKRNAILDELEQVDNTVGQLSRENLEGKDITQLGKMARRFGVKVPQGADKAAIIGLMAGKADLSQIKKTDSGYRVEIPIATTKAGRAMEVHEFDSYAEALYFLEDREDDGGAAVPVSTPKPPQKPTDKGIKPQKPITGTPVEARTTPAGVQTPAKEVIVQPSKPQGQQTGRVQTEGEKLTKDGILFEELDLPVDTLSLSPDVPNFKMDADAETGIVKGQELQGEYDEFGTGRIIVWERLDGRREIITGRHRWRHALETGKKTIPSQLVREKDGYTKEMALTADAETNIRDGYGSVEDYVNYFRNTEITEEEARAGGLLRFAKGQIGFRIGKSASDDVYNGFINRKLTAAKAYAIANGAKGNEAAQIAALAKAGEKSADELEQYARILATYKTTKITGDQGILFGYDDSAIKEADLVSKEVGKEVKSIKDRILAVRGALKRPETAKDMGLEFTDEASMRKEVERLENRLDDLSRTETTPELYAEMRKRAGLEADPEVELAEEEPADLFTEADKKVAPAEAKEVTPEVTLAEKPKAPAKSAPKVATPADANRAKNLRKIADAMDKHITENRREMTSNPTPKRMKEYNSRIWEADNMERTQSALRAMADALDKGELPAELEGVKSKAAIATLVHKGLSHSGGYYDVIPLSEYRDTSEAGKTLQRMISEGETKESKAEKLERERKQEIKKAEEKFRFLKIKGFFPTPKAVVDDMIDRANIEEGMTVLEPSAGKGDIADALKEDGHDVKVIEIRPALQEILRMKGHDVIGDDFLEHEGQYDRILMNPPFEGGQDMEHVRHAYDQLKPGGKLVAIMGEGTFFNSQKKHVAFREWLAEVGGTSEKLENAFKGAGAFKQTGVASRIVEIWKAEAKPVSQVQAEAKERVKEKRAAREEGPDISDQQFMNILKLSADSPGELRPSDVFRVLDAANDQNVLEPFYNRLLKGDLGTSTLEKAKKIYNEMQLVEQQKKPAKTVTSYIEKLTTIFGLSEEQATAIVALWNANARVQGLSLDEWYDKHISNIIKSEGKGVLPGKKVLQKNKAAIEFRENGKAIIHAMKGADVSSLAHETAHIFRRTLSSDDLLTAEEWADVENGKWSKEAEEKFARAFERYLRDGQAPSAKLKSIFEQFKQWLTEIYKTITGSSLDIAITPEIREVFDRLLTTDIIEVDHGKGKTTTTDTGRGRADTEPVGRTGGGGRRGSEGGTRSNPIEPGETPSAEQLEAAQSKRPIIQSADLIPKVPNLDFSEFGPKKLFQGADWGKILKRQRELEGLRAAMRDPKTGKVYTGLTHQAAINSIPQGEKTGAWGRLSSEWDKGTENTGFVDKNGKFISRSEAEKRWNVLTMEDVKDARNGPKKLFQQEEKRNLEKLVGKVTDEEILYHGTSAEFTEFDISKSGSIQKGDWGKGIYLTAAPSGADYYRIEAVKRTDKKLQELYEKFRDLERALPPVSSVNSTPKYNEETNKALREYQEYAGELNKTSKGRIVKVKISPDAKIYKHNSVDGMTDYSLAERAKDKGYDVLLIDEGRWTEEYVALNPKVITITPAVAKQDKDLLGRKVTRLKGGATGKQTEMFDKNDFLTLEERERINAQNDVTYGKGKQMRLFQAAEANPLDDNQKQGIELAVNALGRGESFLLADGAGFGKTRQIIVTALMVQRKTGKPALIITQNKQIVEGNFKPQSEALGVDLSTIEIGTYDDLKAGKVGKGDYSVVVIDEAHGLKHRDSQRSLAVDNIKADTRMFVTATPMDSSHHAAYFLSQISGVPEAEVQRQLGYHMESYLDARGETKSRAVLNEGHSWRGVIDNIIAMRDAAVTKGNMVRREIPFNGKIEDKVVSLSGNFRHEEADIFAYWQSRINRTRSRTYKMRLGGNRSGELSRYTEIKKLPAVFEAVIADLQAGKKVIVVAEGVNETRIKAINVTVPGFLGEFEKMLTEAGYDYAQLFDASKLPGVKNRNTSKEVQRFQSGEVQILLMTPKTGGAGIDLDDSVGNNPRSMYIVTANYGGDIIDQVLHRVSRRNTKSPARIVFFKTNTISDNRRDEILERKLQTLRAIQRGEDLDRAYGFEITDEEGNNQILYQGEMEKTTPLDVQDFLTRKKNLGPLAITKENVDAEALLDAYFAERDEKRQEANSDKINYRNDIKEAMGDNRHGGWRKRHEMADHAMHVYIDLKNNPDQMKYYDKLGKIQKRVVDAAQNLSPELKKIADRIAAQNKKLGIQAYNNGVINNVLDNYTMRLWVPEGTIKRWMMNRKFGTKTARAKHRTLEGILHGWSLGKELQIPSATEAQEVMRKQISDATVNRQLLKTAKAYGLISGQWYKDEGWIRVEHPNFTDWQWAGRAAAAVQDYGVNFFVTKDGNLLEQVPMYATPELAKHLNNVLGTSALYKIPGVTWVTEWNARLKRFTLFTSFFHHQAYIRSYNLGGRTGFTNISPKKAYNAGRMAIENFSPDLRRLVRNGLTVGEIRDYDKKILRGRHTLVGRIVRQVGPADFAVRQAERLRDWNEKILFEQLGPYFKVQAALLEYKSLVNKYEKQIKDGTKTLDDLAKMAANLANDDFGGLHLDRKGRNPTVQHLMRLLLLAPDWTESNVASAVKAFQLGDEGAVYRAFWARIASKGLLALVVWNYLMAMYDDDPDTEESTTDRFVANYKEAWKSGKMRWMDVDITPIYKILGGRADKRKYFSLLGHFKDPIKFIARETIQEGSLKGFPDPVKSLITSAKFKGSVMTRIFADGITGKDWAGREFTTLSELLGTDDKGVYSTNRLGMYSAGEPKGGKLKGELTKFSVGGFKTLGLEQIPSFLINEAKSTMPIQVQNAIAYLNGQTDGFDAILKSAGVYVSSTYSPYDKLKNLPIEELSRMRLANTYQKTIITQGQIFGAPRKGKEQLVAEIDKLLEGAE